VDRGLRSVGHAVDSWRVHRRIGICSPQLLESLLGDEAARLGERASAEHTHYYHDAFDQLRPLAGARELLYSVADLGLQVVLATSAKPDELDRLRQVLDADGAITAVVGSGDVETAKPAPDLVGVALERAGCTAEQAIFVSDTLWDVRAAGAVAIYDDAAQLLTELANSRSPL